MFVALHGFVIVFSFVARLIFSLFTTATLCFTPTTGEKFSVEACFLGLHREISRFEKHSKKS
jgi:hypothetical protein